MLETDYFGYTYTRPPNYVVAGMVEDYFFRGLPIDVISAMYGVDNLTTRLTINEVLYPKFEKPVIIVRMSKV